MKRSRFFTLLCLLLAVSLLPSCQNRPHVHSYDEIEVISENTCTSGGEIKRKCSCGEGEIYKTVKKSHVLSDWQDNGAGEYVKICSVCHETVGRERIYSYYSENLAYKFDEDSKTYAVTGRGSCTDAVIVIPPEFNGIPVTGIASRAFLKVENVEAVIIPHSVTYISDAAFSTSSIKRVFIPDSVTEIGKYAFNQCDQLIELILPNSLSKIGKTFLQGTNRIKTVIIPSSLKIIPVSAFAYSSIESISLPEGVEKIEADAFSHCTRLAEIGLPETLTEICDGAFEECTALTDIILPDSVTCLAMKSFLGCTALRSVNIPNGVTKLYSETFGGCKALEKVYFSASLKSLDGTTFLGIDLTKTEILIPAGNKHFYMLGTSLIGGNRDTVVIGSADGTIPTDKNITKIGNAAFIDRHNLKRILIPKNITHIGGGAFSGCINIGSISYEGTVAEWEDVFLGVVWYNGNGVSSVKCSDGEAELVVKSSPSVRD